MTVGGFIANARKAIPLSQKQLAAKVRKEDGSSISPQYLNDIEHDRRIPPGRIVEELAKVLKLTDDDKHYLYHLAGTLPADLSKVAEKDRVVAAYRVFRKTLKG